MIKDVITRIAVTVVEMPLEQPFSKRHRYGGGPKEITVREDAPENLRYFMLESAVELGRGLDSLRDIVCRVLRTPPDSSNGTEYPNICGWLAQTFPFTSASDDAAIQGGPERGTIVPIVRKGHSVVGPPRSELD